MVDDPCNIELRMLNYRLKILSIKKKSIDKLMFAIAKIAFTSKTKCSFFSFDETNDDYSVIVDNFGFEELSSYLNETDVTLSQSDWIPMYLSGEDLPGSMSISKIAKYLILPLADWKISIMAISMYQCDYILIQEKDYDLVLTCLSNHIPKIYDESVSLEDDILPNKSVFNIAEPKMILDEPKVPSPTSTSSNILTNVTAVIQNSDHICNDRSSQESQPHERHNSNSSSQESRKQRQITLPLLIPDNTEYCIAGLYSLENFSVIIPTLMEIMFYETEFPDIALLNMNNDFWKLIRIGQLPVGFEVFGVCASISQPLELANIDEYYISSFHTGYCFIPSDKLDMAKELFAKRKAKFVDSISKTSSISNPTAISQPPTFLLATNGGSHQESSSSSSSSNHSEANSEMVLPAQQDKEYGIQLDDDQDRDELRTMRSYHHQVNDDLLFPRDSVNQSQILPPTQSSSKTVEFIDI